MAEEPVGLTARDRLVLALESRSWGSAGEKEAAVARELQLTPVRYAQVLSALLDQPAALAADPVLVGRLRRVREASSWGRSASLTPESG